MAARRTTNKTGAAVHSKVWSGIRNSNRRSHAHSREQRISAVWDNSTNRDRQRNSAGDFLLNFLIARKDSLSWLWTVVRFDFQSSGRCCGCFWRRTKGLVSYSFCLDHAPQGKRHDLQVERKRLRFHVFGVVTNFVWKFQIIASIDLRPAGDPGNHSMHTVEGAKCDQIVLIKESRTRPHQGQMASPNADQLWQFVKAGLTQ